MNRFATTLLFCALLAAGCRQAAVPSSYTEADSECNIYPDYRHVTVPINIAPLHFELTDTADEVVSRLRSGSEELVLEGKKVCPADADWRRLTADAVGRAIEVDVFARHGDRWLHYKPFTISVSPDSIDPWLTYRLISPSYVVYDQLVLMQRNLETYDERLLYDNMLCASGDNRQCVNCHTSQGGNPGRTLFHARHHHGGTLINIDGHLTNVNLKRDSMVSAGVYPAWHPTEANLVAFSTNDTKQSFLTRSVDKIEVFDTQSDLILYDIRSDKVTIVRNDPTELETFPSWSPDGRWLYYCSAHFEQRDSTISRDTECSLRYKDLHYNVYRLPFDPTTATFGQPQLVFDAAAQGLSATLPRISPDGKHLLMAVGPYGTFHIWHHQADLWTIDLANGQAAPLQTVNSPEVESYHSWSSNGRWIVFSSRRYDGNYTRPFFAHISPDGQATKPFELPSDDPDYHRQLLKSYNVPEFLLAPVTLSPAALAAALRSGH